MMKTMRNAAKPVYLVVILAFVGTIIFAWGMDITSKGQRPPNAVGSINGQEISVDLFYSTYEAKYQDLLQTNNDPGEDDLDRIRDDAWNSLVGQALIAQQVTRNNIRLTSEELAEYVKAMPPSEFYNAEDLQTDGQFDRIKYQNYLQDLATNPDPRADQMLLWIESSVRSQVLTNKLQLYVVSTAFVSRAEVRQNYLEQNEKVKVKYVLVSDGDVDTMNIEITDEMMTARYEKDKAELYKRDETATLKYVSFPIEPSAADKDSVKKAIDEIYNRVKAGEDFAELAKTYSQDPGGATGGDLGWFGKGRMVKPFEDAAFALKKIGDVSEPVLSRFGWHVIKLTGRKTENDKNGNPEEQIQASHILLKTEASETTRTEIREKAQAFKEQVLQAKDFQAAAEQNNLTMQTTNPFSPGNPIPGFGQNQQLSDFAFSAKPNTVSEVIDNKSALIVASPGLKKPAGFLEFDEVKQRISRQIHRELVNEKTYVKGDSLLGLLKDKNLTFEAMAKQANLPIKETKPFARHEFVENIGSDPDFIGAAFNLSSASPLSDPIKGRTGCYLMQLVERQGLDESKYTAVADSLYQDALGKKRNETWSKWYREIYNKAEIKDYREEVFGTS